MSVLLLQLASPIVVAEQWDEPSAHCSGCLAFNEWERGALEQSPQASTHPEACYLLPANTWHCQAAFVHLQAVGCGLGRGEPVCSDS